jgi:hypothetical protein
MAASHPNGTAAFQIRTHLSIDRRRRSRPQPPLPIRALIFPSFCRPLTLTDGIQRDAAVAFVISNQLLTNLFRPNIRLPSSLALCSTVPLFHLFIRYFKNIQQYSSLNLISVWTSCDRSEIIAGIVLSIMLHRQCFVQFFPTATAP